MNVSPVHSSDYSQLCIFASFCLSFQEFRSVMHDVHDPDCYCSLQITHTQWEIISHLYVHNSLNKQ